MSNIQNVAKITNVIQTGDIPRGVDQFTASLYQNNIIDLSTAKFQNFKKVRFCKNFF